MVPIPVFALANVLGPEQLGKHTYDSGFLALRPPSGYAPDELALLKRERNGLIYTCRGGFIDTAHVRDYADWALYLGSEIGRNLGTGATIELPDEGGKRRVVLRPIPAELLLRYGLLRTTAPLTHWISFQLSVWHEIATWYGWAAVPGFSEEASAFSPEDLYSNLLGIKLVLGIIDRRSERDEHHFNESVDVWMQQALVHLGAVSQELGMDAMRSVDQLWWDSSVRLPDRDLILRRNFDAGDPLHPWRVPESRLSDALRAACATMPEAAVALSNPDSFQRILLHDWVTLEIEPSAELVAQGLPERLTQDDFGALLSALREQHREALGPNAAQPD